VGWPSDRFERGNYGVLSDEDEMPDFLTRTQWVIDLAEYRDSPDTYQNVALPAFLEGRHRLRLVVPLLQRDELTGFVVLAEPPPPFEFTYEDRDLLKTVGRHVATHLAQHEADRLLSESRQFEAYHRLTAFVMHDLKNLAAQLSLLVKNAEKHKRNPEFVDDAIGTIANSTARMQRLIDQLRRREVQSLDRRTSLAEVARQACLRCAVRAPEPVLGELAPEAFATADPERLTMMVEHLIRNAQEATGEAGSVTVAVHAHRGAPADALSATGVYRVSGMSASRAAANVSATPAELQDRPVEVATTEVACLSVVDTGQGMTPEFIKERLFKPFDTTKGSKGMGIGAYQVREYVKSLGGRLQVQSAPGEGTAMSILLPLAEGSEGSQESESAMAGDGEAEAGDVPAAGL
jgi:signal transduction histidine kinase